MSRKNPRDMTDGEINRRLDALDKKDAVLSEKLIAAGRGYETVRDAEGKSDPLSRQRIALLDEYSDIRAEMRRRYGPDVPYRMPVRHRGTSGRAPKRKTNPAKKKAGSTVTVKRNPRDIEVRHLPIDEEINYSAFQLPLAYYVQYKVENRWHSFAITDTQWFAEVIARDMAKSSELQADAWRVVKA